MNALSGLLSRLEVLMHPRRYRLDSLHYLDEISNTLLRYHDGDRAITASYETLSAGEVGVFPDQIGPWEPRRPGDAPLDPAAREEIISAIRRVYASRGVAVSSTAELVEPGIGEAILQEWNRERSIARHEG